MLGRARASPEKWEDPHTPNHTGTKGRQSQGWAGGRGAWELQPALCWPKREVHSTRTQSTRAFPKPQRNENCGGGGEEESPLGCPIQGTSKLTQKGSQPPQLDRGWVGGGIAHSSPLGAGVQELSPWTSGIPGYYLPGLCSQLPLQRKCYWREQKKKATSPTFRRDLNREETLRS